MRVELRNIKAVTACVVAQLAIGLERRVLPSPLPALSVQVLPQRGAGRLDRGDNASTTGPTALTLLDVVDIILVKVPLTVLVLEDLGHNSLRLSRIWVNRGAISLDRHASTMHCIKLALDVDASWRSLAARRSLRALRDTGPRPRNDVLCLIRAGLDHETLPVVSAGIDARPGILGSPRGKNVAATLPV